MMVTEDKQGGANIRIIEVHLKVGWDQSKESEGTFHFPSSQMVSMRHAPVISLWR